MGAPSRGACVTAPQGDPHNKDSLLNKEHVKEYLMEHYMLDVDVDMFAKGDSVSRADLESFLLEAKA